MSGTAIVSIQSQFVFGCAGNSAAVPLLHRLGTSIHKVSMFVQSSTLH